MWAILGVVIACILFGIVVWIALKPVGKDIERRYPRIVKICGISFAILMLTLGVFGIITDQETRQIVTVKNLLISAAIGVSWLFLGWLYKRYKEDKEETPWGFIGVALLVSVFLLVLYLEFWFLRILEREMAQGQKVFHVYVLTSSTSISEVAVIRNYGDYLYTVPFNRTTHEFETKLVIIKMSESSKPSLTLSLEKIGPLKPLSSKVVP
jgi:cytochrome bd-type quinol oxidase subunit 2